MNIKKLDSVLDWCLWGIAILLIGACWWGAGKMTAPDYERIDSEVRFPYNYETKDGETIESSYELAWSHSGYSPALVAHDFTNGKTVEIKEEYLAEYKEQATPSAYRGWWRHVFWVWFIVLVIIDICLVYRYGQELRDRILFPKIKDNPTFENCTYFLFHDRYAHESDIKRMLPYSAPQYIKNKKKELEATFSPTFVSLIVELLESVVAQQSTEIKYHYSFSNELKPQYEYLENLQNYWRTQLGANPKAQENINIIETLKQQRYAAFPDFGGADEYASSVTEQLNKLFKEIMGSEVFKFSAYHFTFAEAFKCPGMLFVSTRLLNTPRDFSWSGSNVSCMFAGIDVVFSIYAYENREKKMLWNHILTPECNYRATDEDFSEAALYKNMVHTTIGTFAENLKKTK